MCSTNGNDAKWQWTLQAPPGLWDTGITEFIYNTEEKSAQRMLRRVVAEPKRPFLWLQRLHQSCRERSLLAGIPSWHRKFQRENMGRADAIPELMYGGELAGMALGGAVPISCEHMLHPSSANGVQHSYLHPEYKIIPAWAKFQ